MPKIPIVWYIVIALSLYIVFIKSCGNKCSTVAPSVVVKRDTVYVKDSGTIAYVPVEVNHYNTEYLAQWIDTAEIVKDYLSHRIYSDTLRNKYGYVLVIDTISENRIADRKVKFDFNIPEVTLTKVIPQRNQVYGGITLGGMNLPTGVIPGIGAELLLKTKTDKIYHVNAMLLSNGSKFYSGTADFKFHF